MLKLDEDQALWYIKTFGNKKTNIEKISLETDGKVFGYIYHDLTRGTYAIHLEATQPK